MLQALFFAFLGIATIHFLYYIFFGIFLFSYKKKKTTELPQHHLPVSLLICVKDQSLILQKNLPFYLKQSHQDFELILVNYASSDDTLEVMEKFQENDSRIKIVNVQQNERFWGNKKYALTLGIKKASHKHLVFTEITSKPVSEDWLLYMASSFSSHKKMVFGYTTYKQENTFLNKIIRYENVLTAIQYFSSAFLGKPYMGFSKNVAYTAPLFYENNGFVEYMNILSGEADLFINAVTTSQNTTLSLHQKSFTKSKAKTRFKDWYQEKRENVFTSKHYKPQHKIILSLFYLTQLLFWPVAVVLLLLISIKYIYCVIIVVFIKVVAQYIVVGKASNMLNEKNLLWLLPLQDFILLSTQFLIFIHSIFSKPVHGK